MILAMMTEPLPNRFAERMAEDIANGRVAPITVAEITLLAEQHDLAVDEVDALACLAGWNLRATAEAVWMMARRDGDGG